MKKAQPNLRGINLINQNQKKALMVKAGLNIQWRGRWVMLDVTSASLPLRRGRSGRRRSMSASG
jgi:hypothetical protein